jgi:hypothetical protein
LVELSGKNADRFIQHMNEDKPSRLVIAALEHGRKIVKKVEKGELFTFSMSDKSVFHQKTNTVP